MGERQKSQLDVLLDLARDAQYFSDSSQTAFARIRVGDHFEVHRVKSRAFRAWLALRFYAGAMRGVPTRVLAEAMPTIEAWAMVEPVHDTVVRVGGSAHDVVYIDRGDSEWSVIRVTGDGWSVMDPTHVFFRRPKGMKPLPLPERGGSIRKLQSLLGLGDDEFCLIVAWALGALRPAGPYPLLILTGEQDSAKSTTARLLARLLDPHSAALRSEPKSSRDLAIAADNAWVLVFDNLSFLPPSVSDDLCRLATGGGFGTRTLYENREEELFEAQRPVIITSIGDIANRGDLLDRGILVRLEPLPEHRRLSERRLDEAFERLHASVLGALLDAVASALAHLDEVEHNMPMKPRMFDFAVWACAALPAIGLSPSRFLTVYSANRYEVHQVALEGSAIAAVISRLVETRGAFSGTPTELLNELYELATDQERKMKEWPKNAQVMSGRIRRIAPNLRAIGVTIQESREADRRRTRRYHISAETRPNDASVASVASATDVGTVGNALEAEAQIPLIAVGVASADGSERADADATDATDAVNRAQEDDLDL